MRPVELVFVTSYSIWLEKLLFENFNIKDYLFFELPISCQEVYNMRLFIINQNVFEIKCIRADFLRYVFCRILVRKYNRGLGPHSFSAKEKTAWGCFFSTLS